MGGLIVCVFDIREDDGMTNQGISNIFAASNTVGETKTFFPRSRWNRESLWENNSTTSLDDNKQEEKNSLIKMMNHSEEFNKLKNAFQKAFKMPLILCHRDEKGPVMENAFAGQNKFCQFLFSNKSTCEACLVHQKRVHGASQETCLPSQKKCPHGMVDLAVPVIKHNEVVGFLRTGQVFTSPPKKSDFSDTMELLLDSKEDIAIDEVHQLYFQTPVMSEDQIDGIIELLEIYAKQLSQLAQDLELTKDSSEPGIIKKTKEFILANLDQQLSLDMVSKEVHCNSFYLCKLFKKVTGLSFTEFINQQRLVAAKKLLLNQDMRISEVALEAGFQSITHFNRVFRRYLGCSPSQFRRKSEAIQLTLAS